jgi:hypothetical protein
MLGSCRPSETSSLRQCTRERLPKPAAPEVMLEGIVKLIHRETPTRDRGRGAAPYSPLTPPCLEALSHFLSVGRRRQKVATGSEVLGNESICRQKPLGMTGGCKPLHPSLWLMISAGKRWRL